MGQIKEFFFNYIFILDTLEHTIIYFNGFGERKTCTSRHADNKHPFNLTMFTVEKMIICYLRLLLQELIITYL